MKHIVKTGGLAAALALAFASVPAGAQQLAQANKDGTLYCEDVPAEVAMRALPDGGYAINYSIKLSGRPAEIRYASGASDMFDEAEPAIDIFYSAKLNERGEMDGQFDAFTISGTFGFFAPGEARPADGLRLLIVSGDVRTPLLTLSTHSRQNEGSEAALTETSNAFDGNDVTMDWDPLGVIADALVQRGGTLSLIENGEPIATVKIPAGNAAARRPAALAFAAKIYPWLKQGKCPN